MALDYCLWLHADRTTSVRGTLQFGDGQWRHAAKRLDSSRAARPFLSPTRNEIAADAVGTPNIEGRLNGQVMQSSNTSKMIFKVAITWFRTFHRELPGAR